MAYYQSQQHIYQLNNAHIVYSQYYDQNLSGRNSTLVIQTDIIAFNRRTLGNKLLQR